MIGASKLGLPSLQGAYDHSTPAPGPHITLDATIGALTLRDASSPIGDVLVCEDFTGVDFFTLDPADMSFGPSTRRAYAMLDFPTGYPQLSYMPDGGTRTAALGGGCINWSSTVTTNIPAGGGLGNDSAPACIQWIGECIFADQGFVFSSLLLFNQGAVITSQGFNIGPLYTMVNQPLVRNSSNTTPITVSQGNAVRSQPRVGPNTGTAGIVQTSYQHFFAFMTVDGTGSSASCTTAEYFAAQNPSLVGGGTIGTLNVLNIPALTNATTIRGINSAIADAAGRHFIRHIGTARADFGGIIGLGAGATVDVELSRGAANRLDLASGDSMRIVSGGLQFSTDITIDRPAAGSLHVDAAVIALLPGATPSGSDNWMLSVNPAARSTQLAGDWNDVLLTQAANLTIDHAVNVAGWTVNAPSMVAGTGSVTTARALLVQGNVNLGTNRYGLHVLSSPSGGTINRCARFEGAAGVQIDGELELDGDLNHDGTNVGFYGTAPVAQSAAYAPTNVTTDRAYDANSTTIDELADVLGTLIADLQATGLIG